MRQLPLTIGIDLGSWESRVSAISDAGTPYPVGAVGSSQEFSTPSLIALQTHECLVGSLAHRQAEFESQSETVGFIRAATDKILLQDRQSRRWSAATVTALLLRKLMGDAEAAAARPVEFAAVATSDDDTAFLAQCAARLAGLPEVQTVDAALAAAAFHRLETLPGEFHLICDWGHSALRTTLLRVTPKGYRTLAQLAEAEIGGRQLAEGLVSLLVAACEQQQNISPRQDPAAMARVHTAAGRVLATLSSTDAPVVRQMLVVRGRPVEMIVSRSMFLSALQPMVERGVNLCTQCLMLGSVPWQAIGKIVLVGGASQIPTFKSGLLQASRQAADCILNRLPMQALASGAALLAAKMSTEMKSPGTGVSRAAVSDCEYGLRGLESSGEEAPKLTFDRLIRRETPLPTRVERIFRTTRDQQRRLIVDLVRRADKYSRLEDAVRVAIALDGNFPKRHAVRVEIDFTATGEIELEAFDHQSGRKFERTTEKGRLAYRPLQSDLDILSHLVLIS